MNTESKEAQASGQEAVLVIDMVNHFEFDGGEALLNRADQVARNVSNVLDRARRAGIPVVYVNDNFGRWRENFQDTIAYCMDSPGRAVVEQILPEENDFFVLKPKNSGFYATALDELLKYLGVTRLVLTGLTGDNCVLFTANDAYLRGYALRVPEDCTASIRKQDNRHSLEFIEQKLKADVGPSGEIEW